MTNTRIESDSMGELHVPADALWGAQTQRAVDNFPISGRPMPEAFIQSLGRVKLACAKANLTLGLIEADQAQAIVEAAEKVIAGEVTAQFPIDVYQTGSGTSSNMNANEVIAHLAAQAGHAGIHPNDHVNMSQSSNDVIPTTIQVSACLGVHDQLLPALEHLHATLENKAVALDAVVKTGRTHLMDAMPVTFGQELRAWAAQVRSCIGRLEDALQRLKYLPQGGTAVGTGINAPAAFGEHVAAELETLTGFGFRSAENKFEGIATQDGAVELSGQLKSYAVALMKIANDLRWMNSGPLAGIGEIELQALQPGSSIMPGKVNPTQCEALAMIAVQVMGNDVTVGLSGAGGLLEMNVYKPVMINAVLQSIRILGDGATNFAEFLVDGTEPNEKQIASFVENSLMLVTALSPVIGYDKASHAAHHAYEHDLSLRQACLDLGYVNEVEFDRIVDPAKMVHPGV